MEFTTLPNEVTWQFGAYTISAIKKDQDIVINRNTFIGVDHLNQFINLLTEARDFLKA